MSKLHLIMNLIMILRLSKGWDLQTTNNFNLALKWKWGSFTIKPQATSQLWRGTLVYSVGQATYKMQRAMLQQRGKSSLPHQSSNQLPFHSDQSNCQSNRCCLDSTAGQNVIPQLKHRRKGMKILTPSGSISPHPLPHFHQINSSSCVWVCLLQTCCGHELVCDHRHMEVLLSATHTGLCMAVIYWSLAV